MEDTHVKSLKPVAALVAASALALSGCSAGQITQTSDQVAAVDGATAFTDNREVSVQDATVILQENGQAAVKFTATNQDTAMKDHTLRSVKVNGTPANVQGAEPIGYNCVLVADAAESLANVPQSEDACIQYVPTTVANDDFAYGGTVPVEFDFDSGSVTVDATVSAPLLESGQVEREADR
ncbi:hypothetical protein CKJ81_10285 [Corynebacterium hadale]|uniref:Lipoprotein LpqE n=2 Tax=Corynebacterium TaxID=1716 RepID=A0ABX4H7F8_9CORY|nr:MULTISPECIES: hypothetical protein [Corynebacterium]MCG7254741.1 hypothetical protein [Corynebacterium hadale]MCG7257120.1 hypothetical protein [Corynebacterium hadale]MCG7265621.1 hypothetical protein [Corynebacterium hadale]PAT05240.1 hypothetical protein CKJ81_10285 [Corynebacterium hadale]PAT12674.1 hypothetical protein CKJ83_05150 [Corynebacterium hadale]